MYTVFQKYVTTLSRSLYNSDIYKSILITFGKNILDKVGNQNVLVSYLILTKLIVLLHYNGLIVLLHYRR